MYHSISLSSLVTVKGSIPFPAWVRVKIIMYPFTFPIKEYGDEVESQQGVPDTHTDADTHTYRVAQTHAITDTI